jgi:hypothetical protein
MERGTRQKRVQKLCLKRKSRIEGKRNTAEKSRKALSKNIAS